MDNTLFKYNDFEGVLDITDYEYNEIVLVASEKYEKSDKSASLKDLVINAQAYICDLIGADNLGIALKNPKSYIECITLIEAFTLFIQNQNKGNADRAQKIKAAASKYNLHPAVKEKK